MAEPPQSGPGQPSGSNHGRHSQDLRRPIGQGDSSPGGDVLPGEAIVVGGCVTHGSGIVPMGLAVCGRCLADRWPIGGRYSVHRPSDLGKQPHERNVCFRPADTAVAPVMNCPHRQNPYLRGCSTRFRPVLVQQAGWEVTKAETGARIGKKGCGHFPSASVWTQHTPFSGLTTLPSGLLVSRLI